MPKYRVTSPDGKSYEITAPDGATEDEVLAYAQKNFQTPEPAKPAPKEQPYSGSVLPFSKDDQGKVSFDSNAGILGTLKRAVMAPGDVLKGKFDPLGDEARARATEFAGAFSPIPAPMRAGERAIPGVLQNMKEKKPKVPTAEELRAEATKGYNKARDSEVEYPAKSVTDMAGNVQRALEADGIIAELSPKTFTILGKLQNPPEGGVATVAGLDAARKALNHAAGDFTNKTEQAAASRAIKAVDDFLMVGGQEGAVAGAPAAPGDIAASLREQVARTIREARGNYAAASRSDKLTGIEENAELRASAANSGQNLGNTLRQRLAGLLANPKQLRGYSDEEVAAMKEVVEGTASSNTLRRISNLLGGGGGLGQTLVMGAGAGLGGYTAGGPGATIGATLLPAIGAASRSGANALTSRQVGKVDEMIRQRSPLYEQRKANPGMTPDVSPYQLNLLRLFMEGQLEPEALRERGLLD